MLQPLGLAPTLHPGLCDCYPSETFHQPQLCQGMGGLLGQIQPQTKALAPACEMRSPEQSSALNPRNAPSNRKDGIITHPLGILNFLPKTLPRKSRQLSCSRAHLSQRAAKPHLLSFNQSHHYSFQFPFLPRGGDSSIPPCHLDSANAVTLGQRAFF